MKQLDFHRRLKGIDMCCSVSGRALSASLMLSHKGERGRQIKRPQLLTRKHGQQAAIIQLFTAHIYYTAWAANKNKCTGWSDTKAWLGQCHLEQAGPWNKSRVCALCRRLRDMWAKSDNNNSLSGWGLTVKTNRLWHYCVSCLIAENTEALTSKNWVLVQKAAKIKMNWWLLDAKKCKKEATGSQAPQGKQGCLGVTWTGGHAGTFLDVLPLTGCASIQWRGVGAAPTPLLPATPTHGTAGRPGGPRGPATVDC